MTLRNSLEHVELHNSSLVQKLQIAEKPVSISFELTTRCNNRCRHCYSNLPENNRKAKKTELGIDQIEDIADQAKKMGVLWCLLTGGEPLLREDFADIYIMLKRKGLLVSVYTNGRLINDEHIKLFSKYRPRVLEITVYGVSQDTYERVAGVKDSYRQFRLGIDLLHRNGIDLSLKAMVLRSNLHELPDIEDFCNRYSQRTVRLDPFLQKRRDLKNNLNMVIDSERLDKDEIVALEQSNDKKRSSLINNCRELIQKKPPIPTNTLFKCAIMTNGLHISHDGKLRLCSSLTHPDFESCLDNTTLSEGWRFLANKITQCTSSKKEYLSKCAQCSIVNLCYCCPSNSFLETGELDTPVPYFCNVAHARAEAILSSMNQ